MEDPLELCERAANLSFTDPAQAYALFERAASLGSSNGLFGMAELKMTGTGMDVDIAGAEALYNEAVSKDRHPPSMYRLGMLWSGVMGHEEDATKSAEWFIQSAEAGFPPAYPEAAGVLLYGYGVPEDPESAFTWYARAVENNDPLSMFKIGYMLSEGIGTEKDEREAIRMFRMSASAGVPEAMMVMSDLCLDGRVDGGPKAAFNWCRSAADTGFPPARFRMATMMYQAEGTKRDLEGALAIYRELADAGDPDAVFMVGRMIFEGLGVEKDEGRGFELITRAASMGSAIAIQLVEDTRRRQNTQFVRIDGS